MPNKNSIKSKPNPNPNPKPIPKPSLTPIIVLVRPQMGENIGMVARAMGNCEFEHLRLVDPRDGWPDDKAVAASRGGIAQLKTIEVFKTLPEAIADIQVIYATTARERDAYHKTVALTQAIEQAKQHIANGNKCAVLFGPENSGLNNEEIARAETLVEYKVNPEFSSLNLAQAVMLYAYIFKQNTPKLDKINPEDDPEDDTENGADKIQLASQGEISHYIARLEQALEEGNFFRSPKQRPVIMKNLKAYLFRSAPSAQEIRTLEGILTLLVGKKTN